MPPYRGNGGRGSGAGGAGGTVSRQVKETDTDMEDTFSDVAKGTDDVANGVGLAENSLLDEGVHERLATKVQKLAAMDAKLEFKRKAAMSALSSIALVMDQRVARGPGAAGANEPPAEQMNMEHILEIVHNKVSSIMEGADERALESQAYKDLMKKIIPPDGDDDDGIGILPASGAQVSLKCPCTSTTVVDPVKSKVCNHTYGRAAITNHIKIGSKTGGARCPVAGCSHKVALGDLVKDKEMERRLRIENSTQQISPEQDAEEIDDDIPVGETCI